MPVRSSISHAVIVPSLLHADLRGDAMIACMDVGDKAFEPVGDELHRPLQELRQRHRRHLVRVGVHLDAERAADVLADHAHLLFFQPEMLGEQVLHHVRRLRRVIDGHALLGRVPVGDHRAALVAHAGVAAEVECRLDDLVGFGESLVGLARHEAALEGKIVPEIGMDHRRAGIERGLGVGDGGKLLVSHFDQLAGVLGLRPRLGDDRAYRLALPAGAVDRDRMLRRRLDALEMGENANPRRNDFRQLRPGDDRDHARGFFRRCGLDLDDARMRVRRAQVGDMRHARQRDIADVLPAPFGQPGQIRPRHRAADVGVRPVERGQDRRAVVDDFHRKRFGHIMVRHMCDDGELSKPRPSSGWRKLRPTMSTKSSRFTFMFGSNE